MITLDRSFFQENTVAFFPASMGEAVYVQQRLNAMGIVWKHGAKLIENPALILRHGLVIQGGKMYLGADSIPNKYIVCDTRALSPHIDAPLLALEQRVAALEAEIKRLTDPLPPRDIAKITPGRPNPGGVRRP